MDSYVSCGTLKWAARNAESPHDFVLAWVHDVIAPLCEELERHASWNRDL